MGYLQNTDNLDLNQTKFNAGQIIVRQIAESIYSMGVYSKEDNFVMWHNEAEVLERRISPRSREDKNALKEIEEVKGVYTRSWNIYIIKMNKGKKVPLKILNDVKRYLSEYEKVLLYYTDKFGYTTPNIADKNNMLF